MTKMLSYTTNLRRYIIQPCTLVSYKPLTNRLKLCIKPFKAPTVVNHVNTPKQNYDSLQGL